MTPEDEESFSVVDKRRVNEDAGAPSEEESRAEDETPHTPSTEEESAPPFQEQLPSLKVRDRLLMCFDILHQGAWIALGLVADPASGEPKKDLAQAKIAIDTAAFVASQVEAELDEDTRRELKRVVSDLQVNFVRQSQQS